MFNITDVASPLAETRHARYHYKCWIERFGTTKCLPTTYGRPVFAYAVRTSSPPARSPQPASANKSVPAFPAFWSISPLTQQEHVHAPQVQNKTSLQLFIVVAVKGRSIHSIGLWSMSPTIHFIDTITSSENRRFRSRLCLSGNNLSTSDDALVGGPVGGSHRPSLCPIPRKRMVPS